VASDGKPEVGGFEELSIAQAVLSPPVPSSMELCTFIGL
jgi:hypothetical protein